MLTYIIKCAYFQSLKPTGYADLLATKKNSYFK